MDSLWKVLAGAVGVIALTALLIYGSLIGPAESPEPASHQDNAPATRIIRVRVPVPMPSRPAPRVWGRALYCEEYRLPVETYCLVERL